MYMSLCVADWTPKEAIVIVQDGIMKGMDLAKEWGFEGVEMHIALPDKDFDGFANHAAKLGLKISTIATGMAYSFEGYNFTAPDAEARKNAQQLFNKFLDGAKTMGAKVIFGLMKGPLPEGMTIPEGKDMLFESMLPCVEHAEKIGAEITIEAINRIGTDYLRTVPETYDFVNRFKSDKVSLHIDSVHMSIEDADIPFAIRACRDKIGHVHVRDVDSWYPGHSSFNFKEFMDVLKEIGYSDAVGFEYQPNPDPETAAKEGLKHIMECMK